MQGQPIRTIKVPLVQVQDVVVFPGTYYTLVLSDADELDAPNPPTLVAVLGKKTMDGGGQVGTLARVVSVTSLKHRVEISATHKTGYQLVTSKLRVSVEGVDKVKVVKVIHKSTGLQTAEVEIIHEEKGPSAPEELKEAVRAYLVTADIDPYIKEEVLGRLKAKIELSALLNVAANVLNISFDDKQELLQLSDLRAKTALIERYLTSPQTSDVADEDATKSNSWAKYRKVSVDSEEVTWADGFLNELDALQLSPEADERIRSEIENLRTLEIDNPDYSRTMTYIETALKLPWNTGAAENDDIGLAERILDGDLIGMSAVKQKLLEHIAVYALTKQTRGTIICLNGPPGVGKTSVAESIAKAMGRQFGKISLGGVRDEASIRGHRRTYAGAMPGCLITTISKLKCNNPVILLDEIDKISPHYASMHGSTGANYGEVSAALLEVLDPSMNSGFIDHYLNVPFDLSKVIFISTCNSSASIPSALLDRMELIDIEGYTLQEKVRIAESCLLPRALNDAGLSPQSLQIDSNALRAIVLQYTDEAGVRELMRKIEQICRHVAYASVTASLPLPITVLAETLEDILGTSPLDIPAYQAPIIGVTKGVLSDSAFHALASIECVKYSGSGALKITGTRNHTLVEAAEVAMSWVRANMPRHLLSHYKDFDYHLGVKASATSDVESLGLAVTIAIVSVMADLKVRGDTALIGEVSLSGAVKPVSKVNSKLSAVGPGHLRVIVAKADLHKISPDFIAASQDSACCSQPGPFYALKSEKAGAKEGCSHLEVIGVSSIFEAIVHSFSQEDLTEKLSEAKYSRL
jgi:ATP-dependent Lon protease